MDFLALDFETANADFTSVCQVGAVLFSGGEPVETFASLIDPDDYFDALNISIHGIDEEAVRGAPRFSEVYAKLELLMANRVVVSHTSFDQSVMSQCEMRHSLKRPTCRWLDSAMVVRRTWPRYARRGYGLGNVAQDLGIDFRHHDAAEDARVAGRILVCALIESGLALEQWLERVKQPIASRAAEPAARDGNPAGALYGEVIAFTGALSMKRNEVAAMAATVGCRVEEGVTKKTTLLVVGDQDAMKLAPGQLKSSKHLKAEQLMAMGQSIRILRESDFSALCSIARAEL